MIYDIIFFLASIIAVLFVFIPHEYAHAYAAYKSGDWTAKLTGRLTLNPVKHFDPAGFILCIFTGFGWAKPVPINPNNFTHYKRGLFVTAIAGVVTNYIIAFIVYPLYLTLYQFVFLKYFAYWYDHEALRYLIEFIYLIPYVIYLYSLSVFVFNLLPFYPLDGFRIIESCTSPYNKARIFLQKYGYYILMILIIESFVCRMAVNYANLGFMTYFNILGYYQQFAQKIIGFPISAFWDWIFSL